MKPRHPKTRRKNIINLAGMIGVLFLLSCTPEDDCGCKQYTSQIKPGSSEKGMIIKKVDVICQPEYVKIDGMIRIEVRCD